jgi:hypothetical protein
MPYIVDKEGKLIELPWIGDKRQRDASFNSIAAKAGLTNVDFNDGSWSTRIANQGATFLDDKQSAQELSKSIIDKSEAAIRAKAEALQAQKDFAAASTPDKLKIFNEKLDSAKQVGYQNLNEYSQQFLNSASESLIVSNPKNFTDAANNYYAGIAAASLNGIENLTQKQRSNLEKYAADLRSFDSKDLGANAKALIANSQSAIDAINEIENQKKIVVAQNNRPGQVPDGPQRQAEQGKAFVEQDKLTRLIETANQSAPSYLEQFSKYGVGDFTAGASATSKLASGLTSGLADLSGDKIFSTGGLASKLNIQVTDAQILNDINTARKDQYKSLYDTGTSAVTDLQSQLSNANQFISSLSSTDRRRTEAQKTIDDLNTKIAQAQKDTLQAKSLYDNYQPISGENAASTISKFRESLQLPEERTMAQIEQIDPTLGATVRSLADQYKTMAETKIGATTDPATEQLRKTLTAQYDNLANTQIGATRTAQTDALRSSLEEEAANQLRLGSTLGAEEQRQYQQAARAAQTARGNIFGVAPAVQEAVETGAAGEARKLARYGAATQFLTSGQTTGDALARDVALRSQLEQNRLGAVTGFLGSGETVSAALARDVSLRNALDQSRLGAAQQFAASGPSVYNLSSQRLGQQQNLLNNYLAASAPQGSTGFTSTPTATSGYQYVNPNAGFQGAQSAASIYNTLANYGSDTYRTYVSGLSAQQPGQSGASQFAQIAGGIGNIFSPVSSLFKSYTLGGAV